MSDHTGHASYVVLIAVVFSYLSPRQGLEDMAREQWVEVMLSHTDVKYYCRPHRHDHLHDFSKAGLHASIAGR